MFQELVIFFKCLFFWNSLILGVVGNLGRCLKAWCNFATCKDDPRCHSKYTQHFDVRKHLKLDFGRLGILGKAIHRSRHFEVSSFKHWNNMPALRWWTPGISSVFTLQHNSDEYTNYVLKTMVSRKENNNFFQGDLVKWELNIIHPRNLTSNIDINNCHL